MTLENRSYILKPGDICFVPQGVRHYESFYKEDVSYELIDVSFVEAFRLKVVHNSYSPVTGFKHAAALTMKIKPELVHILEEIVVTGGVKNGLNKIKVLIKCFFEHLAQRIKEKKYTKKVFSEELLAQEAVKRKRMVEIKGHINSHFNEKISISKLAQKLSVTPRHLSALFRQVYGMHIAEYTIDLRLKKARALLKDTGLSINEIAFASGFKDPSYFRRIFRKYMEVTPKNYRIRSVKNSEIPRS